MKTDAFFFLWNLQPQMNTGTTDEGKKKNLAADLRRLGGLTGNSASRQTQGAISLRFHDLITGKRTGIYHTKTPTHTVIPNGMER